MATSILRLAHGKALRRAVELAIASALLLGSCARTLSPAEIKEQRVAAIELIEAIEAYRSNNGEYPETLDDLAPDYIAVVPRPPLDDSYFYQRVRSDREFELGFSSGGDPPGCNWMSFFELWDCTGGHP